MSRRLSVDERRTQLLELGLKLFSTRPYDDVSIDDIALEAGVSKGLLYHYFGGKRAFYLATVEMSAADMLEALAPEPDPNLDPADRIRAGLNRYLDFVEARDDAFVSLMRGGLGRDDEVARVVDQTRQVIANRVLERVRPVSDTSGSLLRITIWSWLGAVEAASLDWLAHRDVDRDAVVEVLGGSLLGAMAQANLWSVPAPADPQAN